jgi:hypothetical protein
VDPNKRQLFQEALAKAVAHNSFIALSTTWRARILATWFHCHENHVEGTNRESEILFITYIDIASVRGRANGPRFTISLKRSTQNLQLFTTTLGRLPHLLGLKRTWPIAVQMPANDIMDH